MDWTEHHMRPGRDETRRRFLAALIGLAFGGASAPAAAQRTPRRLRRRIIQRFRQRDPEFRERAIHARRNGELRPLRELNARLRKGGFELLDADVFETPEGWVYDIRILGPAGKVRDVLIDGRTLRRIPDPDRR